jgi:O-antigen ligase
VRLAVQDKAILLAQISCVLFTFFLPISLSLKSIFLISSLALIMLTPYYNKHLIYSFNTLWGRAAVAFFMFIVVACFWSQAPYSTQWMVVGKYLKILYLPILAVCFINPQLRCWTVHSYLAAMFITCIISLLKSKGIVHVGELWDSSDIFLNHIITSFMVAFGSYLAGLYAYKHKGWLRVAYLVLMLFLSYQIIFINIGRTGYLLYFVLMILLIIEIFSIKKALLGVLLFCGLFFLCYSQSLVMQNRVSGLLNEVKSFKQNKETSWGYRIQFHAYAKSLFITHPLIGIGTGGFKYSFTRDNPVPSWKKELSEPHSQYWMILCEQGILGLLLYLFFLGSLFISSFKLIETRPILLGILTAFCIGSLSDTIFSFSAAGYLLILMSALSCGELIEKHVLKK